MTNTEDPFDRMKFVTTTGLTAETSATKAKDGELVSPVPPAAPPLPQSHRADGNVTATWCYRTTKGEVMGYVLRFDRSGKDKVILPLTLWRNAQGMRWCFKAFPNPRPLYGLDRLAAQPSAPVLVVEGEKTADAATKLFPDLVVISWSGGSNASAKADWSPLTGRPVIIWPDADEAGLKAARSVIRLVNAAGAKTATLVSLPDTLPRGWDLADFWPEDFTLADAQSAINQAFIVPVAVVTFPYGFHMNDKGLWWAPESANNRGEPPTPMRVCGEFEVVAKARDEDGQGWSVIITFRDSDGRQKREIIALADLVGDGIDVRRRLADSGLWLSSAPAARERLNTALSGLHTEARARLVSATGWVGDLYVLPHLTIGGLACELVIFRGRSGGTYHGEAGAYQAWRDKIAAPMSGNPIGLLSLSAAFAGPLLTLLNTEGGGLHFRGSSSSGKSTILMMAGSVWGGGGPMGYLQTWRATDNALEAVALAHNDGLLALDELRALSPDAAGAAVYALATGATKARLKSDTELRARPSWRVMILSSGELSFADHIKNARNREKSYAGQELRLMDIPVDGVKGMGVWENIHGAPSPAAFSETLKQAAEAHYGHAGPLFIERFLKDKTFLVDFARKSIEQFLNDFLRLGDTGQVRRGAARFAMIAAAGEIAILLDVVPWLPGAAMAAAGEVFHTWAAPFGRSRNFEVREFIERLKAFLERFGDSRFKTIRSAKSESDIEEGLEDGSSEARSMESAGYCSDVKGKGQVYHIHPGVWRNDPHLFGGMDAIAAARVIRKAGCLISNGGPSRLINKVSINGQKRDFYTVSARILEFDPDELTE